MNNSEYSELLYDIIMDIRGCDLPALSQLENMSEADKKKLFDDQRKIFDSFREQALAELMLSQRKLMKINREISQLEEDSENDFQESMESKKSQPTTPQSQKQRQHAQNIQSTTPQSQKQSQYGQSIQSKATQPTTPQSPQDLNGFLERLKTNISNAENSKSTPKSHKRQRMNSGRSRK